MSSDATPGVRILGRKAAIAQMERDLLFSVPDGAELPTVAKTLVALGWTRLSPGDE